MTKNNNASFFKLFWIYFKMGCFSFGGGFAMMPLIEREVVIRHKWMTSDDIIDVFAVAQSLPGAIAVNSAGIIGYRVYGIKGATAGILGISMPAFLIITFIASFFSQFKDIPYVKHAFSGVRAAVVALISYSAITLSKNTIPDKFTAFIAFLSFVSIYMLKIDAITVILSSIAIGLFIFKFFPKKLIKKEDKHD